MFRPVELTVSGSRRQRRKVPRWLVLLTTGVLAGAGGLLYVQHRYLPPRLSAEESARLQAAYAKADAERQRLQQSLNDTAHQLDTTQAERNRLAQELHDTQQAAGALRNELTALVTALPPDPRGGTVQVRAASFQTTGGKLLYDVMLSRDRAIAKPLSAVMQLVVAGAPKRGPETSVKLEPVSLTMNAFENLRGGVALPEGFNPRQATIHVLDRPDGKLLGMRVMVVK